MSPRRKRRPLPRVPAVRAVEAALFSAGEPVSISALMEATGMSRQAVRNGLFTLQEQLAEGDTVLEVSSIGGKWALQLKTKYGPFSQHLAPADVPQHLLPTLALIAHEQPLKQAELKQLYGEKIYEHVRQLVELGLVDKRREGPGYLLSTTDTFPDYFGVDARDPEAIRKWLDREMRKLPEDH